MKPFFRTPKDIGFHSNAERESPETRVIPFIPIRRSMRTLAAAQEPLIPHDSFTLQSALTNEVRRINVYTPPDYDAAGAVRYTVLSCPTAA